ncbi:lysylphosphatidylglycerol synthase domain-containing protein [Roseococcus pinisoli]|uniref:Flippase-like domain-containing protein n=1 Tax=Roseococcus pinisoli TaxID=2835040 RepID=A0ABS5QF93_9PROT|nr:lysylphosphatidylglycerol synthase domain-containing protein [Roseococcus pinisoli]MBS7811976.1 flippase-like domain-containing protein [Roseococcus pinisoli]
MCYGGAHDSTGEAVLSGEGQATARWWRRGLWNGAIMAVLAVGALIALNHQELPGLGRILAEMPSAVAVSAAVHLPQIVMTGFAWGVLLPPELRPRLRSMAALRWYRESAHALLPAGALLGQAAAARLLTRQGVPGRLAGATATVDITMETVSQLLFTLAGIALLLAHAGDGGLVGFAMGGLGFATLGAGALIVFSRRLPLGLIERGLARLARRWPSIRPEAAREVQEAILSLHTAWPRLLAAISWHTISWVLGAVEIALVLNLLGHPVSLADAVVIEALAQALRNLGILLPGALAVQEGAIIAAAALVGVPPGAALAAALVRRSREVAFSLPGLFAWQRAEVGSMPVHATAPAVKESL